MHQSIIQKSGDELSAFVHAELLPVNKFELKQVLYFRRVSEKLGSHCTYVDGSEM